MNTDEWTLSDKKCVLIRETRAEWGGEVVLKEMFG